MRDLWLSIDFEDIAHDFKREHGIDPDGPLRAEALFASYEAIDAFLRRDLGGVRITFFTTGIVAAKCPAVVARIAADGHEIGCHYHFHDPCRGDSAEAFEANLRRAIDALEDASGQRVLGFRAPRFSLRVEDAGHFRALDRHLAYDSSLVAGSAAELEAMRARLGLDRLTLLPVAREKAAAGLPPVRPGGSYMKLFPGSVTARALEMAAEGGLAPLVYLHPYEFMADQSFRVAMAEMAGMPARRRLYWAARQAQWHVAGNRSILGKLRRLARDWRFAGPMKDLLPA